MIVWLISKQFSASQIAAETVMVNYTVISVIIKPKFVIQESDLTLGPTIFDPIIVKKNFFFYPIGPRYISNSDLCGIS